ncbi:DUF397 domain-containing protein [Streptomyces sp. NPDC050617]|uniref:DUF397 domain-containing protein n=1 Tax=Streptomyces sp. NPDC050617 TaxID=3154628 RepID=UPI0034145CDE
MPAELNWQKSSFSGGGDGNSCVELVAVDGKIWLRESEAPRAIVTAAPAALRAFVRSVKADGGAWHEECRQRIR